MHVCVHMWIVNLYDSVCFLHWFTCVCLFVHGSLIVIMLLYGRATKSDMFGAGLLKYNDVVEAYCYVVNIGRIMSRCITDAGHFGHVRLCQLHTKLKILQCETGYIVNLTNGAT